MQHKIQKSLKQAINYLAGQQTSQGAFVGMSAADKACQLDMRPTETIFFTALIAECLNHTAVSRDIVYKCIGYLGANRSNQWTWNYWQRQSSARPYPDDLDDTACALLAIFGYDNKLLSPAIQAHFAHALISCETQPGGPYTTWLTDLDQPEWKDIDIAVNANIATILRHMRVNPSNLEKFLTQRIMANKLQSPYYVGRVPILYFLARGYNGRARRIVRKLVYLELLQATSALHIAMLITAAHRLGVSRKRLKPFIYQLVNSQRGGGWPASALYVEPPEVGNWRYAGSAALTTAFVVEALGIFANRPINRSEHRSPTKTIDILQQATGCKLSIKDLHELSRAQLQGGQAYTIYDDFLDGDGNVVLLGSAHTAARFAVRTFSRYLPAEYVETVFSRMDRAQTWEARYARDITSPPDYASLLPLADRSWGMVLAPTAVIVKAGYAVDSPQVQQLQRFFRHYIIARQLCDDAHDWEIDYRAGRVSPVVAMLLKNAPYKTSWRARRLHFWRHTIDEVNILVRQHLQAAWVVLQNAEFIQHKEGLEAWLEDLEMICVAAETGRAATTEFIKTFNKASLVA